MALASLSPKYVEYDERGPISLQPWIETMALSVGAVG